jgi:predicted protein tyrosine phosphatase
MRAPTSTQGFQRARTSSGGDKAAIHVCSLDKVWTTIERERPSHLVTLLHNDGILPTPAAIDTANHLRISIHDISTPQPGMVHPGAAHVERILAFARDWDRAAPMVVHCLAGISRSTATAFITACALNPLAPEALIAQRIRALSPTASPNILLVEIADQLLRRDGRMIEAIEDIGYGEPAMEGWPFALASEWPMG